MLIRSVYNGATAPDRAQPESFTCESVSSQLEAELWILYDTNLRTLDAVNAKREPLPGRWRNWEATRVAADDKCPAAHSKLAALGVLRRTLEGNLFLLAHEAGAALAEIHR